MTMQRHTGSREAPGRATAAAAPAPKADAGMPMSSGVTGKPTADLTISLEFAVRCARTVAE
jgi:hypothetical protein